MSEVLLIRLGSGKADTIAWMVWSDAEQEIIASGELKGAAELEKLTEHGNGRDVRVLVPACDVTMKTVTLPGKFTRQLQAALPYMLEDELSQDVDKLFFAIGEKGQQDGKPVVEVAVVDRTLMQNWRQWLEEAELKAVQFVPDALCMPLYEQATSSVELNDQWLVRADKWDCSSIDSSWFGDYLNLAAARFEPAAEEEGQSYRLMTHSPCLVGAEQVQIEEQSPELPLKLLMSHLDRGGFNLLQGEFAFKKEGSKFWKTWKTAVIVAAAAIVMQLTYRGGMAWHLGNQLEQEKAEFTKLYKQAYPNSRIRPNLMERDLRSKLKAAKGGGQGGPGFLAMLEDVAPLFTQSSSFTPRSFRFDAKRSELRFDAVADGFQDFEKFKSAAEKQGFSVQQGSLSNDNGKVSGAITIKKGG